MTTPPLIAARGPTAVEAISSAELLTARCRRTDSALGTGALPGRKVNRIGRVRTERRARTTPSEASRAAHIGIPVDLTQRSALVWEVVIGDQFLPTSGSDVGAVTEFAARGCR